MICLHCKPNKEPWFWSSNAWFHIVLVMLLINKFVMIKKRKIECKKKRKGGNRDGMKEGVDRRCSGEKWEDINVAILIRLEIKA